MLSGKILPWDRIIGMLTENLFFIKHLRAYEFQTWFVGTDCSTPTLNYGNWFKKLVKMLRIVLQWTKIFCEMCLRWTGQGQTCQMQEETLRNDVSAYYLCQLCHWNEKQTTEKFCLCFYDPAYAYMVVNVPEPWMVLASYSLWWLGNAVSFWGTFLLMSSLWLSWQHTLDCWILTWLLVFCFITKSHNKWECNICLI